MPIKKLTLKDIETMKAEIATNESFAKPLIREAEMLNEISKTRNLTLQEERRENELKEILKKKREDVNKLTEIINSFYIPATA